MFWFWLWLIFLFFFRNKTFGSCLKKNFVKPHKIPTQSDNRLKKWKLTIVWISWISWNFVRFHEIPFQTDSESFSFLSWKTKKFYSSKIAKLWLSKSFFNIKNQWNLSGFFFCEEYQTMRHLQMKFFENYDFLHTLFSKNVPNFCRLSS